MCAGATLPDWVEAIGQATNTLPHCEQRTFDPVGFSRFSSNRKMVLHCSQVIYMAHLW